MAAIPNNPSSVPNAHPTAPNARLNSHPDHNVNDKSACSIRTIQKITAVVSILLASCLIALACVNLPFSAALTVSICIAAIAIPVAAAILSDCNSVTVVDGRPSRTYFWHHWWPSYPSYSPVYPRPVYMRRPDPIIITREPRIFPSYRAEPHVRVGGGHRQSTRIVPSFTSQPHFRGGIPHRAAASVGFGGGPRVQVGGGHRR